MQNNIAKDLGQLTKWNGNHHIKLISIIFSFQKTKIWLDLDEMVRKSSYQTYKYNFLISKT